MAELSGQEILDLLNTVLEKNQESNKEMITNLAFQISHPAPTAAELAKQKNMWEARVEAAKIESSKREHKRIHCVGKSDKPHHRPNQPIEGLMRGESLIQWRLTQFSSRNAEGRLCLSQPTPVGVCIWCHSEFKPGDPDYMEAISWGVNTQVQAAAMNIYNGDWAEMVDTAPAARG